MTRNIVLNENEDYDCNCGVYETYDCNCGDFYETLEVEPEKEITKFDSLSIENETRGFARKLSR